MSVSAPPVATAAHVVSALAYAHRRAGSALDVTVLLGS